MNKYAAYNHSKGLTMGYYKTEDIPLYPIAKKYTLCDSFFHSGFGDSYFNHVFLIAAQPKIDRWGPGTRIPAIIIGPFAKNGFVGHWDRTVKY